MKRKVAYAQFYRLDRWKDTSTDKEETYVRPMEVIIVDRSWDLNKQAAYARNHLILNNYYAFSLHLATKPIGKRAVLPRVGKSTHGWVDFANKITTREMEIHLW